MKSSGWLLILVLLSGFLASAVAQPTTNQVPPKDISAASKDDEALRAITSKIYNLRLPEVRFGRTNLAEIVHQLNEMVRQFDRDKLGVRISFAINSTTNSIEEINSNIIKAISLKNTYLSQLLNEIELGAEKPLQHKVAPDGRVVFSMKTLVGPDLRMKTFRINTNAFNAFLNQITNIPKTYPMWQEWRGASSARQNNDISSETNQPPPPSIKAAYISEQLGVDLHHPPGKALFYNDRLGLLFIKATPSDLDLIDKAISRLKLEPSATNK